jgi:predicted ATPase
MPDLRARAKSDAARRSGAQTPSAGLPAALWQTFAEPLPARFRRSAFAAECFGTALELIVLPRSGTLAMSLGRDVELRMDLPVPFISRVRLKNYKSIAQCDVQLGPLTVLIGPNGAGKSNFLDALRFVADAVSTSPDQAIAARGGLGEILRRSRTTSDSFSIELDVTVPWGPSPSQWAKGRYGFEIASADRPGQRPFLVRKEWCELEWEDTAHRFAVSDGHVEDSGPLVSESDIDPERLYLPLVSVRTSFAPLYAGLRGMYFYDPDPSKLRDLQPPTDGAELGRAGEHLGDVLGALDSPSKQRFDAYMRVVVPELASVERKFQGSYVTVELRTRPKTDAPDVTFGPNAMSDGTIRAAGLLAALYQPWVGARIRLVGIEEPELALHPAAAGALFDALIEASDRVQLVVTTQSPDLLDRDDIDVDIVRVANIRAGATIIGQVDTPSRQILGEKLATVGQLLRGDQISPESGE